jgi:hypothetical protein
MKQKNDWPRRDAFEVINTTNETLKVAAGQAARI